MMENMKKEMEEKVSFGPYGKGELAQKYYPYCTPSWALRLFNKDLQRFPGLTEALRQRGWRPTTRLLRKDWVRLIFEAIDPP